MFGRLRDKNGMCLLTAMATVVAGCVISSIHADVVRREEDRRLRVQLERRAFDRVRALTALVQTSLDYAESVKGLFLSSSNVEPNEFHAFVQHVLASKPHIRAWEWVPVVPAEHGDDFEREARRAGFPDYTIHSLQDADTPASVYYPVLFTEPFAENRIDLGLDYGSIASRRDAIERARDQRRPCATDVVPLERPTDPLDLVAVQIFVPVHAPTAAGKNELIGFVSLVLPVRQLVNASLTRLTPAGIDLFLYEDTVRGFRRHIYTHASRTREPSDPLALMDPTFEQCTQAAGPMHVAERLDVAGRTWWVVMTPAPQFFDMYGERNSRFVLIGGFAFSTILGYVVFLTTRRVVDRAERARLHLAAIVESSADAMYTKNIKGEITSWNAAAERLFGYKAGEIIGQPAQILQPPDPAPLQSFADRQYSETRVQRYEAVRIGKDGQPVDVSLSISPIRDAHGDVKEAAIIAQDITERKRVEKMKDDFIYLASHQLRTPLTTLRLYAEMLLDGHGGELQPKQREFVGVIDEHTRRMVDLVTTLLNISRIDGATMMVRPEPQQMSRLLRHAIEEVRPRAEAKRLDLIEQIDHEIPMIEVDPVLVHEIYANLLSNAVKYTPPEGIVSVTLCRENDNIVTRITDTGYGIPQKDRKSVFTRFYRGENILAFEAEGTGLGLYLVKALCDLSGCSIAYQSEEGEGTTFLFTVPQGGMNERAGTSRLESMETKREEKWQES